MLARDGQDCERAALCGNKPTTAYVTDCLGKRDGPVIAASDYVKAWPEMIRAFVPAPYVTLGTDGFGRSDTREALRDFFEVDRRWIALAALKALHQSGAKSAAEVSKARKAFGISPDHKNPRLH